MVYPSTIMTTISSGGSSGAVDVQCQDRRRVLSSAVETDPVGTIILDAPFSCFRASPGSYRILVPLPSETAQWQCGCATCASAVSVVLSVFGVGEFARQFQISTVLYM